MKHRGESKVARFLVTQPAATKEEEEKKNKKNKKEEEQEEREPKPAITSPVISDLSPKTSNHTCAPAYGCVWDPHHTRAKSYPPLHLPEIQPPLQQT